MGTIARVWLLVVALLGGTGPALAGEAWLYTVRPGDNLWDIARAHLSHMRFLEPLQQLNGIENPYRLRPGSRLRIPLEWIRLEVSSARVIAAEGDVRAVRNVDDSEHVVGTGYEIHIGDTLITGSGGSATVEFGDGSQMLVAPGSEVVFDLLQAYGESGFVDTRVRLKSGRTEHKTRPRRRGTRYEITTPAATTAVRGTQYRVGTVGEADATAAEVVEGQVEVAVDEQARQIPRGFGVIAKVGVPLAPPRPLLPAPDTSALPNLIRRIPIQLALTDVTGATKYRVQVADTEDFSALRVDQVLAKPELRGLDLPDGDYFLRQRGIDAEGLEGLDSVHRFSVDARPEPPITMYPPHEAVLQPGPLELQWADSDAADDYHVQVATDASFDALVVDQDAWDESRFALPPDLPPGDYYWRVASRERPDDEGPFGDANRFRRLSPAPAMSAPEVDDDALTLRWAAGLPGDRYELQIAPDREFAEPVVQAVVDEPSYRMPRPASGVYFLRVRTVDADGNAGPFGTTQRIDVPPASYWPYLVPFMLIFL